MALNNNHPFTHSKSKDGFKQQSPIHSLKIRRWLKTTITHSLTQNQKMALNNNHPFTHSKSKDGLNNNHPFTHSKSEDGFNNNHPFTHSKSEDGFKQQSPIHSLKIKRWL